MMSDNNIVQSPIRVRCLLRDQQSHVRPIMEHLGDRAEFVFDERWSAADIRMDDTDLVLCVNDFPYEIANCLDAARAVGIPSLALQDGTLEWRCQYQNPLFGAGGGAPQHQPVLADKIACIGNLSARHIAAWGNATRVEVTGMPHMDALLQRPFAPLRTAGPRRLLVMTAKKPWFDDAQREVILRSLRAVKNHLAGRTDVEVVWRVTRDLKEILGVENRLQELDGRELATVLDDVDAVVSTPSTAILEAMLAGRPVATLDYHNTPRFLPTAWTIADDEHVAPTIAELLSPPAAKLAFQQVCLHDALRCDGPAAPRVSGLIVRMIEHARECRRAGRPLSLPANLVGCGEMITGAALPSLAALYPHQPAFAETDAAALQVRLARLEKAYEKARNELSSQSLGYWLKAGGRYLSRRLAGNK